MGLFDLPGPLLSWIDGGLGQVAPPTVRLILWGLLSGAATMALYWWLSPQRAIAAAKADAAQARRSLDAYEGDFGDAWPLIRRVLGQALRQLRLVLWPALVASLPAICLIVWEYVNPERGGVAGELIPIVSWGQRIDPRSLEPGFRSLLTH